MCRRDTDQVLVPDDITVAGGSLHRTFGEGRATIGPPESYEVKDIFIHPGFAYYPVPRIFEKDIALVVPKISFVLNRKFFKNKFIIYSKYFLEYCSCFFE